MISDQKRGAMDMTAAMLISGTIGFFVLSSGLDPVTLVFWRCIFGAATLVAICLWLGLFHRTAMTGRQLLWAILGGMAIVANWLLLFAAYPYVSISIATTVYNTQPFMLLVLGGLVFGERVSAGKLAWLALAFIGVILIISVGGHEGHAGASGNYLLGVAFALGAAFLYAIAAVVAKALKGVPPHLVALIHVTTGAVMLAPLMAGKALPQAMEAWASVATLGVVHTGVMYILLYSAIQKLPTHMTGALSFIYPIAAILVDRLAFGAELQPLQFLGGGLILLAAAGNSLGWTWPASRKQSA